MVKLEYYEQILSGLTCYPDYLNKEFRAWNTADILLLDALQPMQRMLIIEDEFGALTHVVDAKEIYVVCDNYNTFQAIQKNCRNKIQKITFLSPFELFPEVDFVIGKVPKDSHYFSFLLKKINTSQLDKTPVLFGGMTKYLARSFFTAAEKNLTNFSTSLAWKKARLLRGFSSCKKNELKPTAITFSEFHLSVANYPNVFCSQKLDIGTRFLLETMNKRNSHPETVFDLGCGNGILGIMMGKTNPESEIHFMDTSHSAITSAMASTRLNFLRNSCHFHWNNNVENIELDKSIQMILCNPPFHSQHKITIQTALSMFEQAKNILAKNGEFIVVANHHLGYHIHLKKYFSAIATLARNKKFIVYACKQA